MEDEEEWLWLMPLLTTTARTKERGYARNDQGSSLASTASTSSIPGFTYEDQVAEILGWDDVQFTPFNQPISSQQYIKVLIDSPAIQHQLFRVCLHNPDSRFAALHILSALLVLKTHFPTSSQRVDTWSSISILEELEFAIQLCQDECRKYVLDTDYPRVLRCLKNCGHYFVQLLTLFDRTAKQAQLVPTEASTPTCDNYFPDILPTHITEMLNLAEVHLKNFVHNENSSPVSLLPVLISTILSIHSQLKNAIHVGKQTKVELLGDPDVLIDHFLSLKCNPSNLIYYYSLSLNFPLRSNHVRALRDRIYDDLRQYWQSPHLDTVGVINVVFPLMQRFCSKQDDDQSDFRIWIDILVLCMSITLPSIHSFATMLMIFSSLLERFDIVVRLLLLYYRTLPRPSMISEFDIIILMLVCNVEVHYVEAQTVLTDLCLLNCPIMKPTSIANALICMQNTCLVKSWEVALNPSTACDEIRVEVSIRLALSWVASQCSLNSGNPSTVHLLPPDSNRHPRSDNSFSVEQFSSLPINSPIVACAFRIVQFSYLQMPRSRKIIFQLLLKHIHSSTYNFSVLRTFVTLFELLIQMNPNSSEAGTLLPSLLHHLTHTFNSTNSLMLSALIPLFPFYPSCFHSHFAKFLHSHIEHEWRLVIRALMLALSYSSTPLNTHSNSDEMRNSLLAIIFTGWPHLHQAKRSAVLDGLIRIVDPVELHDLNSSYAWPDLVIAPLSNGMYSNSISQASSTNPETNFLLTPALHSEILDHLISILKSYFTISSSLHPFSLNLLYRPTVRWKPMSIAISTDLQSAPVELRENIPIIVHASLLVAQNLCHLSTTSSIWLESTIRKVAFQFISKDQFLPLISFKHIEPSQYETMPISSSLKVDIHSTLVPFQHRWHLCQSMYEVLCAGLLIGSLEPDIAISIFPRECEIFPVVTNGNAYVRAFEMATLLHLLNSLAVNKKDSLLNNPSADSFSKQYFSAANILHVLNNYVDSLYTSTNQALQNSASSLLTRHEFHSDLCSPPSKNLRSSGPRNMIQLTDVPLLSLASVRNALRILIEHLESSNSSTLSFETEQSILRTILRLLSSVFGCIGCQYPNGNLSSALYQSGHFHSRSLIHALVSTDTNLLSLPQRLLRVSEFYFHKGTLIDEADALRLDILRLVEYLLERNTSLHSSHNLYHSNSREPCACEHFLRNPVDSIVPLTKDCSCVRLCFYISHCFSLELKESLTSSLATVYVRVIDLLLKGYGHSPSTTQSCITIPPIPNYNEEQDIDLIVSRTSASENEGSLSFRSLHAPSSFHPIVSQLNSSKNISTRSYICHTLITALDDRLNCAYLSGPLIRNFYTFLIDLFTPRFQLSFDLGTGDANPPVLAFESDFHDLNSNQENIRHYFLFAARQLSVLASQHQLDEVEIELLSKEKEHLRHIDLTLYEDENPFDDTYNPNTSRSVRNGGTSKKRYRGSEVNMNSSASDKMLMNHLAKEKNFTARFKSRCTAIRCILASIHNQLRRIVSLMKSMKINKKSFTTTYPDDTTVNSQATLFQYGFTYFSNLSICLTLALQCIMTADNTFKDDSGQLVFSHFLTTLNDALQLSLIAIKVIKCMFPDMSDQELATAAFHINQLRSMENQDHRNHQTILQNHWLHNHSLVKSPSLQFLLLTTALSSIYNFAQFLSESSRNLETLLMDNDSSSHRVRTISVTVNQVTQKLGHLAHLLQTKLPYSLENASTHDETPSEPTRSLPIEKSKKNSHKLHSFRAVASFYISTFSFHALFKSLSSCARCVISIDSHSMQFEEANELENNAADLSDAEAADLDNLAVPIIKKKRRNSRRYPIMRSQNQVIDDWLREDRYDESFRDLESFIVPG